MEVGWDGCGEVEVAVEEAAEVEEAVEEVVQEQAVVAQVEEDVDCGGGGARWGGGGGGGAGREGWHPTRLRDAEQHGGRGTIALGGLRHSTVALGWVSAFLHSPVCF